MQDRTATLVPPKPICPPWCRPGTCDVRYDDADGWLGAHAEILAVVSAGDLWWKVQLQQFVSPTETSAPGIGVDTNASGLDWLDADTAAQLAAALLNGSVELRAATALRVA